MLTSKAPLITIIIPTYNRKELLEKAILSVINQKKDISFDRELIIVDDGSQDDTKAYIQKYLDTYPHIHYYYQENAGTGAARNKGLQYISSSSDYTIFLDSDDELQQDIIYVLLAHIDQLTQTKKIDTILGFYFLCVDEYGVVIGNRNVLKGSQEIVLNYDTYLSGAIDTEFLLVVKSSLFINNPDLRFPEDVVTEAILRSKIRKYADQTNMSFVLYDYVGRMYRTLGGVGHKKLTKTIDTQRFIKNARGNEYILQIIGNDLLQRGLRKKYGELLFKMGINKILAGEKKVGLQKLKESIVYKKSIIYILIYICAFISKDIIMVLYRLYI